MAKITVFKRDIKKICSKCNTENIVDHIKIDVDIEVKREEVKNFICSNCQTRLDAK